MEKLHKFIFVIVISTLAVPAFAADCLLDNQNEKTAPSNADEATDQCNAEKNPPATNQESDEETSFLGNVSWKKRLGATDFQVENSHTFGVMAGIKGVYETSHGAKFKLLLSAVVDFDLDHLDPDHIPVWFKSYFKAEKKFLTLSPEVSLLTTLDVNHKMNTVSSIEQSADLMPGIKIRFKTRKFELFAKFGAGGYYLEIDDDLPEIYSDFRRGDLSNSEFAYFHEYKTGFSLTEKVSLTARYKNFIDTSGRSLETREELKFAFHISPARYFAISAEKTTYNLDQFERTAGDNGLNVLPFNEDTFYQAYFEYDY